MSAAATYSKGLTLYRQGRYEQAAEMLAPLAGEPDLLGRLARYYGAQASHRLGLELMQSGQFQAAQACLKRTIDLVGPRTDLAAFLAQVYANLGEHDRAEASLEAACDSPDRPAGLLADLAMAQYRAGRPAQAMMTLRQAVRRYPEIPGLRVVLGLMLCRDDQVEDAREQFQAAVDADCLCADAHYYLGLCEAAMDRPVEAADQLNRALSLRPDDTVLAYQLALAARAAQARGTPVVLNLHPLTTVPPSRDLRPLADLVAREHEFVPALLGLPPSEADAELFDLLSAVVATAIEAHPTYPDLRLHHASILERLGDVEGAVAQAREAVRLHPEYVQARVALGGMLEDEDPAAALEHLEHAIAGGGDYPDVHAAIGRVAARLGRMDQAREAFSRALTINGDYREAREALARLAA